MISMRSTWLAGAAVLVLTQSSCLFSGDHGSQAPAVKDQSSHDYAHSSTTSRRSSVPEPEYFEGDTPPEAPALLEEARPDAPSPAHVWVAGQHTRQHGSWVWTPGRYALAPRADLVWVPGHWVSNLRGYVWIDGAWR